MEEQLQRAFVLALNAHEGQVDRQGEPYFLHVVRVMLRVETVPARIVALLHDVIEDTDWDADGLRAQGFSPEIVNAVVTLTRTADETYSAYIDRVSQHPLAKQVKRADLADHLARNADLARHDPDKAASLARRYRQAWATLDASD